eukprot:51636_1
MSLTLIFAIAATIASASYKEYEEYVNFLRNEAKYEPRTEVLATVPVIWGGYDPVQYFTTNRAHKGSPNYALNITSKDSKGTARMYQVQFTNSANMNRFKNNQSGLSFQYGGFCDWGTCCELAPQWPWKATWMGPPGGFTQQMDGWSLHGGKLYIAFNQQYDQKFWRGKDDVQKGDQRWIGWFGSLSEGILNYMCLSYEKVQYEYCVNHGQPLAPAANPQEEIYPIIKNPPEWFEKFRGV